MLRGDEFILNLENEQSSEDFSNETDDLIFRKQYEEIVDAILDGEQPPVSGEDALRSMAAVEAIYDSCESHSAINPSKYITENFQSSKKLYS